jgi:hypothetical protein
MAVSTTQSIWRSGGGDQTRTSYCGSGVMAADFYIADASVATPTKIAVDSTLLTTYLVLPAGAVVTSVIITDAGSGSIDLNTLGVNSGTASAAFVANGLSVASTGAITSGLTFATVAELSYLTVTIDTSGSGTVGGYITYFVVDPLFGQQNV